MSNPYFQVDAFADQLFRGNQAGVCLPEKEMTPELMQQVAAETDLAVTAFVLQQGEAFRLQWFSPKVELPLCGHGTLAAAHILWEQGILPKERQAVFHTAGGRLTVRYLTDGWLELDFPAFDSSPASLPPELTGLFPHSLQVRSTNDRFMIELDGEEQVCGFIPDLEKLRRHAVILTSRARSGSAYDFISRFFAGPVGVPEDQVTGSAHCSLGPYWSEKLGKKELLAYQASARGGSVKLRLDKDRALVAGRATTFIKGFLEL
jgi:predicted PhzF superfamily epimerase YddE/YHI9